MLWFWNGLTKVEIWIYYLFNEESFYFYNSIVIIMRDERFEHWLSKGDHQSILLNYETFDERSYRVNNR